MRMKVNIILGHAFPVPPSHATGVAPVETQAWRIGNQLAQMDHDVAIYSRDAPGLPADEVLPNGLRVVRLKGYDWTRRRRRDLANAFRYGLRLATSVRDADVHMCKTFFFPFLAKMTRRPRGLICVGLHREPKRHLNVYSLLLRSGSRSRLRFSAVSEFVRRGAERMCPAMKGLIEVVLNPVDIRGFAPGEQKWPEPTVLYAGRIVEEKGLRCLADAFTQVKAGCPEAHLRIVGPLSAGQNSDEELVGELMRKFRAHAWRDDVSFPGFKSGAELVEEYQKAWVVCYPSFAGEACPNVVTEAMACGTPVVTTSFGPFPEQFADGAEGFQVPPHEPGRLADRLLALLQDSGLREGCGHAARNRACQFGLERIVGDYLHAFRKFLLT